MTTTMDKILKYFRENEELFNRLIEELDSYDGYLDDDRWYPMEELDEYLSGKDPSDIVRMTYYGTINPNDDYFRVNAYGNLQSTEYLDYSDHLDKYFVEDLLEAREYIDIDDWKLNDLLSRLQEEV